MDRREAIRGMKLRGFITIDNDLEDRRTGIRRSSSIRREEEIVLHGLHNINYGNYLILGV